MGKLEGKIALITGGNRAIGLATAKEFVSEGAYVFITERRDPELAAPLCTNHAGEALGPSIRRDSTSCLPPRRQASSARR